MRNPRFITTILIFFHFLAHGQERVIIDQPYIGLPSYPAKTQEIDSLNQLPAKIQFIISEILTNSMTDFVKKIKFVHGQTIDLEGWLESDSIPQTEYGYIIPKYQLFFELVDSSLNIQKYCFQLSFDKYGQVTYFEWPRQNYNKKEVFIKPQIIKLEAIRFAKSKRLKTETCIYELKYESDLNKLGWHFSFLQKSTGDIYNYSKEYKTIVVDMISLNILKELNMTSVGATD